MKYKVGDKVKIKSLEWYNSKKEYEYGFYINGVLFDKEMSDCCSKTAVITNVNENSLCYKIDIDFGTWFWYDWMFEDDFAENIIESKISNDSELIGLNANDEIIYDGKIYKDAIVGWDVAGGNDSTSININEVNKTAFEDILTQMLHTYKAKNADYGNSFDKTLNEFGLVASVVRLNDKMERVKSLIKSDAKVLDEKIDDTLLDIANYAILTLLWLRNKDFKNDDVDNALKCLIEFGYDVFSKNDKSYKKLVEFFDKYNKADKAVSDIAKVCFDSDIISGTANDIENHSVAETKLPQEYSVGETFTDANGIKLKAVKSSTCYGCYYRSLHSGDCTGNTAELPCSSFYRKDGEEVKFIKVD